MDTTKCPFHQLNSREDCVPCLEDDLALCERRLFAAERVAKETRAKIEEVQQNLVKARRNAEREKS